MQHPSIMDSIVIYENFTMWFLFEKLGSPVVLLWKFKVWIPFSKVLGYNNEDINIKNEDIRRIKKITKK